MEYYPWSLADLLSYYSNRRYTKSHFNFIIYAFTGILNSVIELHSLGYVHRDLKLENIFLMRNFQVKIGDLAFAKTVKPNEMIKASGSGTLVYMSPELFSNKMNTRDFNRMIELLLDNPWYVGGLFPTAVVNES